MLFQSAENDQVLKFPRYLPASFLYMLHVTHFLTAPSSPGLSGQRHVIRSSCCLLHTGVILYLRNRCLPEGVPQLVSGIPRAQVKRRQAWEEAGESTLLHKEGEDVRERDSRAPGSLLLGPGWQLRRVHGSQGRLGALLPLGQALVLPPLGQLRKGPRCGPGRPRALIRRALAQSTPRAQITPLGPAVKRPLTPNFLRPSQVRIQSV